MSEYYAVQRSGNELAHYGVKGMKWGVRKAIAAGSDKKMGRAYKKAQKKLHKLETKANINAQKANIGVQAKKAIRSGLVTAGAGGIAGLTGKDAKLTNKFLPGKTHFEYDAITGRTRQMPSFIQQRGERAPLHFASGALTVAGAAKTAYHTGKAIASKYRTTKKGHAKAVAKANAWKKEMNKAFAGTKYAKGASTKAGKRRNNG